MKKKKAIIAEIKEIENKLSQEIDAANTWNKGKFKNSSNAKNSNILVEARREELKKLYEQLNELE